MIGEQRLEEEVQNVLKEFLKKRIDFLYTLQTPESRRVGLGYCGETSDEELEIEAQIAEQNTGQDAEPVAEQVEENLSKVKMRSIMDYLFTNKEKMNEGIYLELCNKLKEVHDVL